MGLFSLIAENLEMEKRINTFESLSGYSLSAITELLERGWAIRLETPHDGQE